MAFMECTPSIRRINIHTFMLHAANTVSLCDGKSVENELPTKYLSKP